MCCSSRRGPAAQQHRQRCGSWRLPAGRAPLVTGAERQTGAVLEANTAGTRLPQRLRCMCVPLAPILALRCFGRLCAKPRKRLRVRPCCQVLCLDAQTTCCPLFLLLAPHFPATAFAFSATASMLHATASTYSATASMLSPPSPAQITARLQQPNTWLNCRHSAPAGAACICLAVGGSGV